MKGLFKGTIIVIFFTALFAAAGFGGSYAMKEQWRVEVELKKPTFEQLGNYFELYAMHKLISENKTSLEIAEGQQDATDLVYDQFKQQINSYDRVDFFWRNNNFYAQRQTGLMDRDSEFLHQLIEQTKFVEGNPAKNVPDRLQMTLDNPKQAAELLDNFMNYTNLVTKTMLYNDLVAKWKTLFNQVNLAAKESSGNKAQGELTWKGKLNIMKSVSPLDDKLVAFSYVKAVSQPTVASPDRLLWAAIGGAIGFLFGLLLSLWLAGRQQKKLGNGEI
ncbi:hypothetical protein A4G18_09035 [Pasteurellaceae bacterium Pebbles2]|nr:hypothetical protein [Pasteurellaceae bacterium Pebbles2]